MAKETRLTLRQSVDYVFEHSILTTTEDAAIDISGWTLSWMLKRYLGDEDDAALLEKTTAASGGISIAGTFDADVSANTQRALVSIEADDTRDLASGVRFYELKRMDAGFEAVLAYGVMTLVRGVHRQ